MRSTLAHSWRFSCASIQSTAARFRSVPWRRSPNFVRPLMVALYFSRSSRPTMAWIGSAGFAPDSPAAADAVAAAEIPNTTATAIAAALRYIGPPPIKWRIVYTRFESSITPDAHRNSGKLGILAVSRRAGFGHDPTKGEPR